jgi:uncharacterized metal-binding protein
MSLQQFRCENRGMLRCLKCGPNGEQAAIELAKEKVGGFFCLAGVGAHIKGMVKAGKEADLVVAIDGCPVQCAAKTLQHAEIEPGYPGNCD